MLKFRRQAPRASSTPGTAQRRGLAGRVRGAAASNNNTPLTQDLARDLIRYHVEVQEPARASRPYSQALQDFAQTAILAYECGFNEGAMREQVCSAIEVERASLPPATTSTTTMTRAFDIAECMTLISIVWVTLMVSPHSVRRWATGGAVSDATFSSWHSFVGMISTAYFEKRMSWYPVERLSLELSAVAGRQEPPELVAERARLVFTTLELVAPQFPRS